MTSEERNKLKPAEKKLEWATPKIALMGAGDTNGKAIYSNDESPKTPGGGKVAGVGPS